ncbi:MAG: helix-turn-helix transcriptional regulator [Bacteroidales bacterium]|jgi:transcriptional regulator with XRE-family HTH domain|nr:helix-turn-helix transcriptional regulator [Bacteroidales bacterium]
MNITEKIQTLRKEKGWSIARLAKETDMPTVSLRVMLSRDDPNRYTVKNLKKIADALGVTVSYLTLEEGEMESPAITSTQSEELKAVIAAAIDEYFTIKQPQASAAHAATAQRNAATEHSDDINVNDDILYNEGEELED